MDSSSGINYRTKPEIQYIPNPNLLRRRRINYIAFSIIYFSAAVVALVYIAICATQIPPLTLLETGNWWTLLLLFGTSGSILIFGAYPMSLHWKEFPIRYNHVVWLDLWLIPCWLSLVMVFIGAAESLQDRSKCNEVGVHCSEHYAPHSPTRFGLYIAKVCGNTTDGSGNITDVDDHNIHHLDSGNTTNVGNGTDVGNANFTDVRNSNITDVGNGNFTDIGNGNFTNVNNSNITDVGNGNFTDVGNGNFTNVNNSNITDVDNDDIHKEEIENTENPKMDTLEDGYPEKCAATSRLKIIICCMYIWTIEIFIVQLLDATLGLGNFRYQHEPETVPITGQSTSTYQLEPQPQPCPPAINGQAHINNAFVKETIK